MTNREFYTAIAANETLSAELREYAQAAIEKLDAVNAKQREKQAEKAKENEPIVAAILATLTNDPQIAADIAVAVGVTTAKASGQLRKLVAAGQVVAADIKVPKKGTVKGYSLPVATDAE